MEYKNDMYVCMYFRRFVNGKKHGEGVFKSKKNGNVYSGFGNME